MPATATLACDWGPSGRADARALRRRERRSRGGSRRAVAAAALRQPPWTYLTTMGWGNTHRGKVTNTTNINNTLSTTLWDGNSLGRGVHPCQQGSYCTWRAGRDF